MPAHLIQAMPMLVLGLGALAGIAVVWLRARRAGGEQAALARRDLAVALALAACWAAVWVLYATYAWTAAPGLSTLQSARFYVPALGAISLLGAWLLVRVPRRQPLAAMTTLAVVAALFGLGGWAFHDMYQFPFGPQLVSGARAGRHGRAQARPGSHDRRTGQRGARRPSPGRPHRAAWRAQCPPGIMTASRWTRQLVTAGSRPASRRELGAALAAEDEVRVRVDEAGQHGPASGVHDQVRGRRATLTRSTPPPHPR